MLSVWIKMLTVAVVSTLLLGGCATSSNKDPLESVNRGVYKFNDTVDKAALKPIAGAYKAVVPSPLRTGVNNFFSNLDDFVSCFNHLLQGKVNDAVNDAGRFAINTTFGVAGLLDLASKDNIKKQRSDFGQTLLAWGWENSAYLVLPLLGPSSVRDASGLIFDRALLNPVGYVNDPRDRNSLNIVNLIDVRSNLLAGSDMLDGAALDPYVFIRDAYLQRRRNQSNEGAAETFDYNLELYEDDY